ncbi:MAG TPA: NAD-dependent epimerase/dehydratase family protein [Phycisphaerales bacterium]|nr:NAD-dependent epimerase/dehydratase family protein [Phycisphaerales bacterium]
MPPSPQPPSSSPRPQRPDQPSPKRPDRPSAPAPMPRQPSVPPIDPSKPILILGATGAFGGALAFEFLNTDRRVRLLVRENKRAIARFGPYSRADYVRGDVTNAALVSEAAAGCSVIVHAVNCPYTQWDPFMRTATENVIAAARENGATILFPGNVYPLGPPPTWKAKGKIPPPNPPLREDAPAKPVTKKGRFRAELEEAMKTATADGRCRVINLRAGDYFGPTARNALTDAIFGSAARGKAPRHFGRADVPHQWVYLPDLAYAATKLLELSTRFAPYQVVNFAGHTAETQREFLDLVREHGGASGKPRCTSWSMVRLASLVNPMAKEMLELRYLFDEALLLDDSFLRRIVPGFHATPIGEAITATIQSYRSEQR